MEESKVKYFIVEGVMKNQAAMNDDILRKHVEYSSKNAVEIGLTLVSGVKGDNSGGISIMKGGSLQKIEAYLANDPLKTSGIQEYHVIEILPHYINPGADEWFKDNNL